MRFTLSPIAILALIGTSSACLEYNFYRSYDTGRKKSHPHFNKKKMTLTLLDGTGAAIDNGFESCSLNQNSDGNGNWYWSCASGYSLTTHDNGGSVSYCNNGGGCFTFAPSCQFPSEPGVTCTARLYGC